MIELKPYPIIGFDLDGCLCNLTEYLLSRAADEKGLEVDYPSCTDSKLELCTSISEEDIFTWIDEGIMSREVPCYPHARTFIHRYWKEVRPPEIVFISKRLDKWYNNTYTWIRETFGANFRMSLYFTPNKGKKAKELGLDVFVEDQYDHTIDLIKHGVFVFMPDRPWNTNRIFPHDVRARIHRFNNWNFLFRLVCLMKGNKHGH